MQMFTQHSAGGLLPLAMGLENKIVTTNVISYTPKQPPAVEDSIGLFNTTFLVPKPLGNKQLRYVKAAV